LRNESKIVLVRIDRTLKRVKSRSIVWIDFVWDRVTCCFFNEVFLPQRQDQIVIAETFVSLL